MSVYEKFIYALFIYKLSKFLYNILVSVVVYEEEIED